MRAAKRTIDGVKLRRSLRGRWVGVVNKHTVTFIPRHPTFALRQHGWDIWLAFGIEPLGHTATLTAGIALVKKKLEKSNESINTTTRR